MSIDTNERELSIPYLDRNLNNFPYKINVFIFENTSYKYKYDIQYIYEHTHT